MMTGRELYEKRHPYGVRWSYLSRNQKKHWERTARALGGLSLMEAAGTLWRKPPGRST